MKTLRFFLALTLFAFLTTVWSQADTPAEAMAESANNFLVSLTPEQKAKAVFELKADERFNWHFIPRNREGLPLKEMTTAQRHLAYALLNSALSQRGFMKATTIMSLEEILREMEKDGSQVRDPERYFVTIFGTPESKGTWAWRVEGHHLSLNFTVVEGKAVSVTPSFLGSNPGEVREGPRKGLRVLAAEEDLARQLVRSLKEEQRKIAVVTETAPKEIITGADRKAKSLMPMGLSATKMNSDQREILWRLVKEYVTRCRSELAELDLKKIEQAGKDKLHFAWAGSVEPREGHYYRVQGPTFLLEYDNTQNNANHIHAVWRDLENDFGEDLLRKHYEQHHAR